MEECSMIGDTISRHRTIGTQLCSLFLFPMLLMAQEWWETKPYIQWSADQVYKILNDSPWVIVTTAGVRPLNRTLLFYPPSSPTRPYSISLLPIAFRVSLITAKPVREALLRRLEWSGTSVNAKDYKTESEKERLERFIASSPNDVRVKGDERYIIVALTLRVLDIDNCEVPIKNCKSWLEDPNADELSKIDTSAMTTQTSLATNTNRVALARYEPPGPDRLGAKYYFPRKLANGAPLIASGDKELIFDTRINNSRLSVKFNLTKMSYNGKPET
jgi:hypothetical protein